MSPVCAVLFFATLTSVIPSPAPLLSGPCNSYQVEIVNEGYYKCVHSDSLGSLFIGIGFSLDAVGAESKIESVGGNYSTICKGHQCLNDSQIKTLFNMDMIAAVKCASKWLSNWNQLNDSIQSAVADMAFSMGCSMLNLQTDVKSDLEHKENEKAVQDLGSYTWCNANYNRCDRDAHCIVMK